MKSFLLARITLTLSFLPIQQIQSFTPIIDIKPTVRSKIMTRNQNSINSLTSLQYARDNITESALLEPIKDPRLSGPPTSSTPVHEVKTLVWKASYEMNNLSEEKEFYFITVLPIGFKVDEFTLINKLRVPTASYENIENEARRVTKIELACPEMVKEMSGYSIGSVKPINHATALPLYVCQTVQTVLEPTRDDSDIHSSKSDNSESTLFSMKDIIDYASSLWSGDEYQNNFHVFYFSQTISKSKERTEKRVMTTIPVLDIDRKDLSTGESVLDAFLSDSISFAKLRKKVMEFAMKPGRTNDVKHIVNSLNKKQFTELMETKSVTKNALHMASWKGDLETVKFLVEISNLHGLSHIINQISTGMGNYGKTPIFYACTQNRNDIVQYLLSCNPSVSVLIVNNKGQSVVSLAQAHLDSETRLLVEEREYEQLHTNKESFVNYRDTHSDGQTYGDLDPRFISFEKENKEFLKKVQLEIDSFRQMQQLERSMSDLSNVHNNTSEVTATSSYISTNLFPKAVLKTTPKTRRQRWMKYNRNDSKMPILPNSSSNSKKPQQRQKIYEEKKVQHQHKTTNIYNELHRCGLRLKSSFSESPILKEEKIVVQPELLSKSNIGNLHALCLSDIEPDFLSNSPLDISASIKHNGAVDTGTGSTDLRGYLVDDKVTLLKFKEDVMKLIQKEEQTDESDISSEERMVIWGIDCEWKPMREKGEFNPVATLQLAAYPCSLYLDSIQSRIQTDEIQNANLKQKQQYFLIDLFQLCQSSTTSNKMTENERILNDILSCILNSPNQRIVGFGLNNDINRLTQSYPHVPCFKKSNLPSVANTNPQAPIIELTKIFRSLYTFSYAANHGNNTIGLQKSVALFMNRFLKKNQQQSNWENRPLSDAQIEYALLDAAVLPILLDIFVRDAAIPAKSGEHP